MDAKRYTAGRALHGEPSGGCGGCRQQHPIPQRPCRQDRRLQSTGKPEEIFLSGSDPRIPQTVEVFSIENRSVQYAMLACGYVDGIAAHETGILQYMKDNAVDFRILEEPLLVTGLGIAFAKNDTRGLDSQLTDTLAQMRADGTLERIVGRYLENASQYLEVDTIGA